jgi:DNA-binding transcriptional LysR family regulator
MSVAQPRLESLHEFSIVARRLSFRAAADELGIDVTVLSRRISRLEERLGVQLLHRTTRRVTLTEAGSAFFARCEDIVGRIADAEAEISRYHAKPAGMLRIAVPNVYGQRVIAPILPEFMSAYPDLRIELTFSDRMTDLVDAGFDAAVRIGALQAGGDLVVRRLCSNPRHICASPRYLETHGTPEHPSDLANHRVLHFSPRLDGQSWKLRGPTGVFEAKLDPVLRADNVEALRHAALAGLVLALLAEFVAGEDLEAGRLTPIMTRWRPLQSDVSFVYPAARVVPRKVRVLLEFLVRKLRADDRWSGAREKTRAAISSRHRTRQLPI